MAEVWKEIPVNLIFLGIKPAIYAIVPRLFMPSYPGYLCHRTPAIHALVPRIFMPSYPGYSILSFPQDSKIITKISSK